MDSLVSRLRWVLKDENSANVIKN